MEAPAPYSEPPPVGPIITIRRIDVLTPLTWLGAGWRDMRRAPLNTLFFGFCFWAMALILGVVFQNKPEYAMSVASGCLLVGPFLAMGLYDLSRRHEQGLPADFFASLTCWRYHLKSMGLLVLVFMVIELLWGRASLVVFAVFFNTGMPTYSNAIQAIFNLDNLDFLIAYLMVGSIFAFLVFSTSVVSVPFIRDKEIDAITAAITSIRVVVANTLPMLLWGALLTALVMLALLPLGAGLVLIGPWLGHATWHAYRGTVHYQLRDCAAP